MELWPTWLPPWLKEWSKVYLLPFLRTGARLLLWRLIQGLLDTFLLFTIPAATVVGSEKLWEGRYRLTPAQQETVARWAEVSDAVAHLEDVPPVTPLVLWYKEGGLQAINPDNCEGIMGLHSAVRSGRLPCFRPGPIDEEEVARQLRIGAAIFKEHCPEVHYTTTDPELLKRCYLYYNAGRNTRQNPDRSGYVMNGYDAAHQNMLHRTAGGQVVRLQALGAWPVHLAIQAQLAHLRATPMGQPRSPLFLSAARTWWEGRDRVWAWAAPPGPVFPSLPRRPCLTPRVGDCFVSPHDGGRPELRPQILAVASVRRVGEAACDLFPGAVMEVDRLTFLTAPMPGRLARYADRWGDLTVQVENDEWIVWLSGLRAAIVTDGEIGAGQLLGTVGGSAQTFYVAIYDKTNRGFVDPRPFLAQSVCPAVAPTLKRNPTMQEDTMNLAALLPLIPLILGLFWALWLFFRKDLLAKGPVQVIVYFVGVILALWIIGWLVDTFLPQWVAQRLLNAQRSRDIQVIQQVSRDILNEAIGAPSQPTIVVYTPAPPPAPAATPIPPTPPPAPTAAPIPPTPPAPVSPPPTAAPLGGSGIPIVPAQSAGEQVYIVRSGDTLFSIARRFGVSMAAIQQRNNIANPNDIKVGQQIIIPVP